MRVFDMLAPPITAGVILVVGVLLGHPHSKYVEAALIVAIAFVSSTLTCALLSRSYQRWVERVISTRLAEVARAALLQSDGMGELRTKEDLSAFERVINVEIIWIIGRDFKGDSAPGSTFLDVIKYNLYARNVTYVYVAPEEDLVTHQLQSLRKNLGIKDNDRRLHTVPLAQSDWERLPYTAGNFTIYDPLGTRQRPVGYFWYPGAGGESFGRLGDDVVEKWIAQIEGVCPSIKNRVPSHPSAIRRTIAHIRRPRATEKSRRTEHGRLDDA